MRQSFTHRDTEAGVLVKSQGAFGSEGLQEEISAGVRGGGIDTDGHIGQSSLLGKGGESGGQPGCTIVRDHDGRDEVLTTWGTDRRHI